jgi:hypothetical protein
VLSAMIYLGRNVRIGSSRDARRARQVCCDWVSRAGHQQGSRYCKILGRFETRATAPALGSPAMPTRRRWPPQNRLCSRRLPGWQHVPRLREVSGTVEILEARRSILFDRSNRLAMGHEASESNWQGKRNQGFRRRCEPDPVAHLRTIRAKG